MKLHGWGIWAGPTMGTGPGDKGPKVRGFEALLQPPGPSAVDNTRLSPALPSLPRPRSALRHFNQFQHGSDVQEESGSAATEGSETVFGYVKFGPTATDHIVREQLLSIAALNQLGQSGAQQI